MKKWKCSLAMIMSMCMLAACGGKSEEPAPVPEPAESEEPAAAQENEEAPEAEETSGTETDFPEMTLSYSVNYAESNVYAEGDKLMKEAIEEATGGKVKIDIYYSSSLVPQDQEIASMMSGDIDMCATGCSWLSEYIPELSTLSAAYVFNSYDHWYNFYFNSQAWKDYCETIASQTNCRFLSAANNGSRTVNLTTDKKVQSRADLAGIKMRMPGTESWLFMGEALGSNPVAVAYSDLYLSLQTGAVDGQDNPVAAIKDQSFYEVTKSVTMTQHVIADQWITIREDLWQSMPEDLRQIFQDAAKEACDYVIEKCHSEESDTIEFLKEQGLTVYELTPEELASFKQEVLDYYMADEAATANWDMDLLDAINALE